MKAKVIRVVSIDYDGCLSHTNFQHAVQKELDKENPRTIPEICMEENPLIIQKLKVDKTDMLMVGSNRQDLYTDVSQSQIKDFSRDREVSIGSCFSVLHEMSRSTGSQFDPFVLGDLYSQNEPGFTVNMALDERSQKGGRYLAKRQAIYEAHGVTQEPLWAFDDYKISIVYAQIQKLALENPDAQIEYTFIDDREDILEAVEEYFSKNPEMIPGNVTIKTSRY